GLAWSNKGDDDRAIADYDQAVDLDPKLADAYYALGLAWAHKGDHDQAIIDYDQAIALNQKSADFYSAQAPPGRRRETANAPRPTGRRQLALAVSRLPDWKVA
ncbi:MAG: tetratricopeptide repeat protein, partial [Mesorhizobium sp.]